MFRAKSKDAKQSLGTVARLLRSRRLVLSEVEGTLARNDATESIVIILLMLLSQLVSALPKILSRSEGDPDIISIEENSRNVKSGSLFVARRGTNVDGHKFIYDAISSWGNCDCC